MTTTDEKQAQKKRIIWILGIGFALVLVFYLFANGIASVLADASALPPVE